jgi:hypothetical protein
MTKGRAVLPGRVVAEQKPSFITRERIVIPTGAYPDFLLAMLARTTGAVFRKGNRMKLINGTTLDRKFGGA